jgi:hypothetical protein
MSLSPLSLEMAAKEAQIMARSNLLKDMITSDNWKWKTRAEAVVDIEWRFGMEECKPVKVDSADRRSNGTCAIFKCFCEEKDQVCKFILIVRRVKENGEYVFKTSKKGCDLEHCVEQVVNGRIYGHACEGKYLATEVYITTHLLHITSHHIHIFFAG